MTAKIIDGTSIAADIQEEVKIAVEAMQATHNYVPGLATVLVGENPASTTYVRMKQKRCAEVGIRSIGHNLPEDISQEDLEELVGDLNADPVRIRLVARALDIKAGRIVVPVGRKAA